MNVHSLQGKWNLQNFLKLFLVSIAMVFPYSEISIMDFLTKKRLQQLCDVIWARRLLFENNESVLGMQKWALAIDLGDVRFSLVKFNKSAYSRMWTLQGAHIKYFWNSGSLCYSCSLDLEESTDWVLKWKANFVLTVLVRAPKEQHTKHKKIDIWFLSFTTSVCFR